MREFLIEDKLQKFLIKIRKKDRVLHDKVMNKIKEILNCKEIEHYKNLRYDMKESKRVHVGHFVLIFSYDKTRDFIYFEDFDHHDNVYRS